jgi:hypothetical protein
MATLDADDLTAIRTIVQEELSALDLPTMITTQLNSNVYIQRLDTLVSTTGLTISEHNQLMGLENTSTAEATKAARTTIALAASTRKR